MKVVLKDIMVGELTEGYSDDGEGGVTGYGGRLDIRPPYQREFVYEKKEREAVIRTVNSEFPLNLMYWSDRGDSTFEVIDGQQRTISIAQYVDSSFALDGLYVHNLTDDQKERILNYKLTVYVCSGTDSEKLEWFKTINIAGKPLKNQELLNAIYAGPWLSDAKKYFSRGRCPAKRKGGNYLTGDSKRQDYLESVIKWISDDNIVDYMGTHQFDEDATVLWEYFKSVIDWVESSFPILFTGTGGYPNLVQGVHWGILYNQYKDIPVEIEKRTVEDLIDDDEVTNKRGIYPYLLTGEKKDLQLRVFPKKIKERTYRKQDGCCARCDGTFDLNEMEADHVTPWTEGGRTTEENCQMLCKECNRRKGAK